MNDAKPPTQANVPIALGMAAVLLLFVVLLSAVVADPRGFDFSEFYMGAWIIRQGNASRLYDLTEQTRIERKLFNRKNLLPYVHPPFEALLFAPFARLSYTKAYILWGAVSVLLWLFSQHLLWRHIPIPRDSYHYFLLTFLFFPLWGTLIIGQITLLLLFLFSVTFVYLKRGQDFRAGIFLGLGLFKFPVVLPFAVICLLRSKWRLMAGFAASASLLGALSVIAVGPAGVRSYANLLIDIARHPDNPAYVTLRAWKQMPTVRGFFAILLTGQLSAVYISVLAVVAAASLILFVAWRWRQEDRARSGKTLGLMFAAAMAISQVTAPHLYAYDLTLMLLPVLLVIGSSQWSQRSKQRMVLISTMVILYFPPAYYLLRWEAMSLVAPVLAAFALAAISLARKGAPPLTIN